MSHTRELEQARADLIPHDPQDDKPESNLPPDPDGMNADRAEWAHRAVLAFETATGTDREDALCDLLADLMHWCNVYGQDFDHELGRARMHYEAETEPEQSR